MQMHSFLRVRILSAVDHLTMSTFISLRKRLFDLHQCTLLPLSIRNHRLNWDMRLPLKVFRVSWSYQEIVSHLLQINQEGVWYELYRNIVCKGLKIFLKGNKSNDAKKKFGKLFISGAIIGDGDRKSWDARGPMIWDNFSIFRTNCAILTSYIHARVVVSRVDVVTLRDQILRIASFSCGFFTTMVGNKEPGLFYVLLCS